MKVIFLDFDGVITTPNSEYTPLKEKTQLIKNILDITNSKIVLSTSWRPYEANETIEQVIKCIKNNPYYNENLDMLFPYIVGYTPRSRYSSLWNYINPRGREIEQYLNNHTDIENYVIVDDENISSTNDEMESKFIQTDHFDGITEEDVDLIIKLLENS